MVSVAVDGCAVPPLGTRGRGTAPEAPHAASWSLPARAGETRGVVPSSLSSPTGADGSAGPVEGSDPELASDVCVTPRSRSSPEGARVGPSSGPNGVILGVVVRDAEAGADPCTFVFLERFLLGLGGVERERGGLGESKFSSVKCASPLPARAFMSSWMRPCPGASPFHTLAAFASLVQTGQSTPR